MGDNDISFTPGEICEDFGWPTSTLTYYRREFIDQLEPHIIVDRGTKDGIRYRYQPQAKMILMTIHTLRRQNMSINAIKQHLAKNPTEDVGTKALNRALNADEKIKDMTAVVLNLNQGIVEFQGNVIQDFEKINKTLMMLDNRHDELVEKVSTELETFREKTIGVVSQLAKSMDEMAEVVKETSGTASEVQQISSTVKELQQYIKEDKRRIEEERQRLADTEQENVRLQEELEKEKSKSWWQKLRGK